MRTIQSKIDGQVFKLHHLEAKLKPLGYDIGSNWEYDHGYFDYQINNDDERAGYIYLRVPFTAVDGQLDSDGTSVKLGTPFLLAHTYQESLDDQALIGNISASFNQFQEPKNKDARVPKNYLETAGELVSELEAVLLNE
ncbi:hypothetical protein EJF36_16775 [Bacillus sp. HMF5848]|uniref:YugN-like family protein n=1 Tax=Bacillus sp. HMF5848 TaxID=2495421 RepID=UPI000F7B468B|nr:YugN-like family protein [Bacillus sp. HMF5848]RSK28386.1 hypothetical protein EJF36_16775 [Bacillus sp. HMF5848]